VVWKKGGVQESFGGGGKKNKGGFWKGDLLKKRGDEFGENEGEKRDHNNKGEIEKKKQLEEGKGIPN